MAQPTLENLVLTPIEMIETGRRRRCVKEHRNFTGYSAQQQPIDVTRFITISFSKILKQVAPAKFAAVSESQK